MNSKFFGLGAKLALCLVATLGTLTSCYEKEDIKTVIDTTPKTVTYTISGSVYDYENLEGINGASVVLSKGGTEVKSVQTADKGQFSITLSGLKDADRGEYTLTATAKGFKERKTNVTIFFEKAENQTIATHMDFALKSADIQGDVVKVVAGAEEKTLEITGTDEGNNSVVDKVVIPAGVFPNGETKTISLIREGKKEEIEANAVRVWEGKPDGTTFEKALEFTFEAAANQDMKVYYDNNGVWELAAKDAAITKNADGTYTAKIWHFSRFKFSDAAHNDYTIKTTKEEDLPGFTKTFDLSYHNASNETKMFPFKAKGFVSGAKLDQSLETLFATCPVKDEAIGYMKTFLDANYIETPGTEYKMTDLDIDLTVEAHSDLVSVTVVQEAYKKATYTMTIVGVDYVVTVTKVGSYVFTPKSVDYTHGHGIGHGTGHGSDLNAGGGIINFE